jgi:hypothetical protein
LLSSSLTCLRSFLGRDEAMERGGICNDALTTPEADDVTSANVFMH